MSNLKLSRVWTIGIIGLVFALCATTFTTSTTHAAAVSNKQTVKKCNTYRASSGAALVERPIVRAIGNQTIEIDNRCSNRAGSVIVYCKYNKCGIGPDARYWVPAGKVGTYRTWHHGKNINIIIQFYSPDRSFTYKKNIR